MHALDEQRRLAGLTEASDDKAAAKEIAKEIDLSRLAVEVVDKVKTHCKNAKKPYDPQLVYKVLDELARKLKEERYYASHKDAVFIGR